MDTPIFGRRHQIHRRSYSICRGAVEVKPDNEMEIDDKGQGEVKDAASTDSVTADIASSENNYLTPPPLTPPNFKLLLMSCRGSH